MNLTGKAETIAIPSVQIVTDSATSSTLILETRVGLARERTRRPRRMAGGALSWDEGVR